MATWKKIIVSGSQAELAGVTGSFTGSYSGDGSALTGVSGEFPSTFKSGISHDATKFFINDGASKFVSGSQVAAYVFGEASDSGDATIGADGGITINADSVENSMLANMTRGTVKVGGTSNAPTDLDAKTDGQILVGDGTDINSVAVSGDVTLANNGAVTIANDAVETAMIGDEQVTLAKLAHAAANTVLVRDANSAGDPSFKAVANTQILIGDGTGFTAAALSGDVTMTNAGAVTIANDAVETAMIAHSLGTLGTHAFTGSFTGSFTGTTNLPDLTDGNGIADFTYDGSSAASVALDLDGSTLTVGASGVKVSDGGVDTDQLANDAVTNAKLANITRGSIKVGGGSNAPTDLDAKTDGQILVGDGTDINSVAVSGDISLANNGAVTIASNAVEGSMLNSNVAGSGLDYTSNELRVDVSDFMTNGANNRVLTATGTDGQNAEANLTFDGSTLALTGAMTVSSNLTVSGDLTVTGDTIEQQVTNLNVEDKFILLNSGSSTATDESGIIFGGANGSQGTGTALIWNGDYNSNDGRLAIANTVASDASSATVSYYIGGVFLGNTSNAATAQADHPGNIRIESDEIYIYV